MLDLRGPIRLTPIQWHLVHVLSATLEVMPVPYIRLAAIKESDDLLGRPFTVTDHDCHRAAMWVSTSVDTTIVFDLSTLSFYVLPLRPTFTVHTSE